MFNSSTGMTPADFAAINGNNNSWNDGAMLWWIIIIICLFGGGFGSGWNNSGVQDQYTLASDFATLQRQIDSTATNTQNMITTNADSLQRQVTQVADGIASLGYDQLSQMNGINQNISNAVNSLSTQMSNGFCNSRYENLQNSNATQNMISTGFADTNYNNATNTCALKTQIGETGTALATQLATSTRDVVDSNNVGVQAILAKLNAQEIEAKNDKISALTAQVNALNLAASQQAQNNYIVSQLSPTPRPAYIVQSPYASYTGCSGCGTYSTTVV